VSYELRDACPGAGGAVIAGTDGTFFAPDDGDYEIEVVIPEQIEIHVPSRVWLSLTFDRSNAGVMVGGLPLVGFSGDVLDIGAFGCDGNLGGVPAYPRANFAAEVYLDAACPAAFPAYLNVRSANSGLAPGASVIVADDIEPDVSTCEMVALEVGVRNRGAYDVELRSDDGGKPAGGSTFGVDGIPGTHQRFFMTTDVFRLQRYVFDTPIAIPSGRVWAVLKSNNDRSQWILTRHDGDIGHTAADYATLTSSGWVLRTPAGDAHAGFQVVITCAGEPPVGACCDMLQTDENDEAVCRDVPRMNCAWPLPDSTLQPDWVAGATCAQQPFSIACGVSACCRPDDLCENLTRTECDAVEPVDWPRQWSRGELCDDQAQRCPWSACLLRSGTCMMPHDGTGCADPWCCDSVCDMDAWCCHGQWDRECVRIAGELCDTTTMFDSCYANEARQAALIEANGEIAFSNTEAEHFASDPPFECRLGPEFVCLGGAHAGIECATDADCPDSRCERQLLIGQRAFHTVWFRFYATAESVALDLCGSDSGLDSVIQIFGVGDETDGSTACNTLQPMACKDDSVGCSGTNRHGRMCVDGLVPGALYYIMVGSKTRNDAGFHKLALRSPCQSFDRSELNDLPSDALEVGTGRYPFDFSIATPDGAVDDCAPADAPDVWYALRPGLSGWFTLRADVMRGNPDAVAIATYHTLLGMTAGQYVHTCDNGGAFDPAPGAVTFEVRPGDAVLVRLVHVGTEDVFGDLVVETTTTPACRPLRIELVDPPAGIIDARRPHAPTDAQRLLGIDRLWFRYADDSFLQDSLDAILCWHVCETRANLALRPPYPLDKAVNSINDIRVVESGLNRVRFVRPIAPGEWTTVSHIDVNGRVTSLGPFAALPGDVNADGVSGGVDILDLVEAVNAMPCSLDTCPSVWGPFSLDVDRSGALTPADILEVIDLLNGAGAYAPWINAELPDPTPCP